VLAVSTLVEKEYNVDLSRRYLTGNSMGGGGTWWIGARYADRWAAIAPGAYGGVLPEDVPALSKLPIRVVVGERDDLMLDRVRETIGVLKAGGVSPEYIEVPGGTHASAFETELPNIFKFFENHAK
jgi:predicted peptidase